MKSSATNWRNVRFPFHVQWRLLGSVQALAVLVLILGWIGINRSSSSPAVSRLESPRSGVNEQTCAECHAGIVANFATSPHANTLRSGSDAEMLALFAGESIQESGHVFSFTEEGEELWFGSDEIDYQRRVDWIFGSGHHALTPVSIDQHGLTQLTISRFSDGKFRTTPGTSLTRAGVVQLGEHQNEADARRCFGCHVSRLRDMTLTNIKPGLDCSRCHFDAKNHASSSGVDSTKPAWRELSPLESVNRCGECHRRPDEMKPEEISIHERHLVRFAPVGLVMSRCFEVSNASENEGVYPRLDCITCHDPHLPSQNDPGFFEAICRSCHTPSDKLTVPESNSEATGHPSRKRELNSVHPGQVVTCTNNPLDSSCLSCHMRKTKFAPGLRFTDHWIR